MNVGRSSFIIASGTFISRALGFVRSILLAVTIGNSGSQAAAAFGLANQLPNTVYTLVAGGVLSAVLVPQIVQASRGADKGESYISKLVTLGGSVFLVLTIIATLAAPFLVDLYASQQSESGGGFTGEQMAMAVALAYWCMPQILFYAIYTLLGEIYNARGQFAPYTWAPIVNNLVAIAGLGLFLLLFGGEAINRDPGVWGPDRIALLGLITTGGVAVQALVLIFFFRRTGLNFTIDFGWRGVGLRATGTRAMWLFGVVIIGQIKGLAQTRVATMAGPDDANLFVMQNAWYIFSLPHSIIAVSIAIAFFTQMSQHAAKDDIPSIRRDVSSAMRSVGMLTTISMFAIAVVAIPLARLYDSNYDEALKTAWVIWALMPCLVVLSAEYVLQRVFFALGDTRTAFFYAIFGMFVTLGLLWACTLLPPSWVVAGAAFAVTVANFVSFTAWTIMVRWKIGSFGLKLIAWRHLQYHAYAIIASLPGIGVVWALGGWLPGGWATSGMSQAFITCILAGLPIAAVYFGLLYLTKDPDFRGTLTMLLNKVRGKRA